MSGLCILLLLHTIQEEIIAINVALHKNGQYCGKAEVSEKLFDGLTDDVVSLTQECFDNSSLEVHLGAAYHISYVVLYAGKENDQRQLDFFLVFRTNDSSLDLCSQYPYVANGDRGMRVNCEYTLNSFWGVKIECLRMESLHIAEIEVHSLAYSDQTKVGFLHRGCFKNLEPSQKFCEDGRCALNSECLFAGFQDKKCTCICKLSASEETSIKECQLKCKDGINFCGGTDSYSVYLTAVPLPSYKGCFKIPDDYERTSRWPQKFGQISVAECLLYCEKNKFMLFNKNEGYCSCEDGIGGGEIDASKFSLTTIHSCNTGCKKGQSLECGQKAHVSLYTTCKNRFGANLKCSELFQCSGSYDEFGACQGGCTPGFFGEHCLGRAVSSCDFEPCDNATSTCRNLNDSFICDCRPGYVKDVDEYCKVETIFDKFVEILKMAFIPRFLILGFIVGFIAALVGRTLIKHHNRVMSKLSDTQMSETKELGEIFPRLDSSTQKK